MRGLLLVSVPTTGSSELFDDRHQLCQCTPAVRGGILLLRCHLRRGTSVTFGLEKRVVAKASLTTRGCQQCARPAPFGNVFLAGRSNQSTHRNKSRLAAFGRNMFHLRQQ